MQSIQAGIFPAFRRSMSHSCTQHSGDGPVCNKRQLQRAFVASGMYVDTGCADEFSAGLEFCEPTGRIWMRILNIEKFGDSNTNPVILQYCLTVPVPVSETWVDSKPPPLAELTCL